MRSFDRAMPEELNRVLTDHLAELLLCSSRDGRGNLRAESVAGEAVVVGDVMVDVALRRQPVGARGRGDAPRAHGARARRLPAADRASRRQRRRSASACARWSS